MKLSDRKIDALADKIAAWMEKSPDVEFLVAAGEVRRAIVEEFQAEKELERQLDADVEAILEQNEARMRHENIDAWVMRKKVRQQLARERGIIL